MAASRNSPVTIIPSPATFDDLPRSKFDEHTELYRCEGFWYLRPHLAGAIAARSDFTARDDDVFLASSMKTGTTWLKALLPAIISADEVDDPLVNHHPNELVPSLEIQLFAKNSTYDVAGTSSRRRLFRTHVPYEMLPETVKSSRCKVVYVTRDPKDVVVSLWHFVNEWRVTRGMPRTTLDRTFNAFCQGEHPFGPFHDHVAGYWRESLNRPEKILFMRYEEMKRDPAGEVRKLAEFIGRPLVEEEEVEKVVWRCSLERLKSLEVNSNGMEPWVGVPNGAYFRNGVVGAWTNTLTKEMAERLDEITRAKLEGSGLQL